MNLERLRKEIDKIDKQIINLLNKRSKLVTEIGKVKLEVGAKIYVPERELFILKRLAKLNKGPISNDSLQAIYREIMSASIALEKPLTIVIFADEDLFCFLAAYSRFGHSARYLKCESLCDFFEKLNKNKADYGVCPLYHSLTKNHKKFLNLLASSSIKICAEIPLPKNYFELKNHKSKEIHELFLVLGKQDTKATGTDKTLLCITGDSNTLTEIEKILHRYSLKAQLLASSSSKRKQKMLFLEIKGHITDKNICSAIQQLQLSSIKVQNLGSYPLFPS